MCSRQSLTILSDDHLWVPILLSDVIHQASYPIGNNVQPHGIRLQSTFISFRIFLSIPLFDGSAYLPFHARAFPTQRLQNRRRGEN